MSLAVELLLLLLLLPGQQQQKPHKLTEGEQLRSLFVSFCRSLGRRILQ